MDKKKKLLVIVLVFVILVGGASVIYSILGESMAPEQLSAQEPLQQDGADDTDGASGDEEAEKTAAPDFTVYDADGQEVHLSDFIGKPTVLNFWASWCGPCQMEMPDFDEKYLESGDDINFLMVNMTTGRETLESAMSFIEDSGYSFPVFYDTQSSAGVAYNVYSLPTTYFIDAEGYIAAQATGAIDADTLQQGIDMITQ